MHPPSNVCSNHEQSEPCGPRSAVRGPSVLIAPSKGWRSLRLGDLWEYRELLGFLIWRDIKVRYKQTVLGAAWAVIQPFFTMIVFTIFFGRLAKIPSENVPYPIFAYAALLPWYYFAGTIERAGNSLVGSSHLITKVYFPRLVIPISSSLTGLLDFCVAFLLLIAMMVNYHIAPGAAIFLMPVFLLMALAAGLGAGLWLSALNVQYRDVRYVIPFLTQFWLFLSPVAYPSSMVPERWRTVYGLNPMAGVIEGFRWTLLGRSAPPPAMLLCSVLVTLLLLVTGIAYFKRMERVFADVV